MAARRTNTRVRRDLDRQRRLTLQVAERLYLASQVLSVLAEKKEKRSRE